RGAFVDRDVVCLCALDEVLRVSARRVMGVALDPDVGGDFLENGSPNPACFRVPFDVITPPEGPSGADVTGAWPSTLCHIARTLVQPVRQHAEVRARLRSCCGLRYTDRSRTSAFCASDPR